MRERIISVKMLVLAHQAVIRCHQDQCQDQHFSVLILSEVPNAEQILPTTNSFNQAGVEGAVIRLAPYMLELQ